MDKKPQNAQKRAAHFAKIDTVGEQMQLRDELRGHLNENDAVGKKRVHVAAVKTLLRVLDNHENAKEHRILLFDQEQVYLKHACSYVKLLMHGKFDYAAFYADICAVQYLPLEYLWVLNRTMILPFHLYVDNISSFPKVCSSLKKSIIILCTANYGQSSVGASISSGLFQMMVLRAHAVDIETEAPYFPGTLREMSLDVLRCIVEYVLEKCCQESDAFPISESAFFTFNGHMLEDSALQSFYEACLNQILKAFPTVCASSAFVMHHKWSCEPPKKGVQLLMEKVVMPLESETVTPVFNEIMQSGAINWELFLSAVAVWASCKDCDLIFSLVQEILQQALKEENIELMYSSFIVVRHVFLVRNLNCSHTYTSWFKEAFGGLSALADSKGEFEFLMLFLSELVPHEQEKYLKAHIEILLPAASGGNDASNSYIALAKSKLMDLTKPQQIAFDKILSTFESTGKIPATVLASSMLQKHHYLNKFLPALLAPRVLPEFPDARMKLIQALKKAEKIPKDMYDKYEEECSKARLSKGTILLTEVPLINNQLADLVKKFKLEFKKRGNKELMLIRSLFVEFQNYVQQHLKQVCKSRTPESLCNVQLIDEAFPHEKAISELINCHCYVQHTIAASSGYSTVKWDLVDELLCSPCLCKSLMLFLKKKLLNSHEYIMAEEFQGLASLLAKMAVLKQPDDVSELIKEIFDEIGLSTSDEIIYFSRLAPCFLKSVVFSRGQSGKLLQFTSVPIYVPCVLLKKFQFVLSRLNPCHREPDERSIELDEPFMEMNKICESSPVQHWLLLTKLSTKEWLKYECKIIENSDYFKGSERMCYLKGTLNTFRPAHNLSIDKIAPVRDLCSVILSYLLSKNNLSSFMAELLQAFSEYLQELSPCTSGMTVETHFVPWIIRKYYSAREEVVKNKFHSAHVNILTKRYLKIVCDLPPFLLFGDLPTQVYLKNGAFPLANLINDLGHCCEGFLLSSTFTCHILKGFFLLFNVTNNHEFEKRNLLASTFLSAVPLFVCSITSHYHDVKQLVTALLTPLCKRANFFSTLEAIEFMKDKISLSVHSEMLVNEVLGSAFVDRWLIGFILMELGVPDIHCKSWYNFSNPGSIEVISTAILFHISLYLSSSSEGAVCKKFVAVVNFLVENDVTSFLSPQHYENCVIKQIMGKIKWYHFPAGCLKLLMKSFPPGQTPYKYQVCWLSLMMQNFIVCKKLYHEQSHEIPCFSYEFVDGILCKKPFGILDYIFLCEAKSTIDKLLISVNKTVITALPLELRKEFESTKNIQFTREDP